MHSHSLLFTPQARHIYICDFHKARIQCARTKRRRRDSEDDSNETDTDLPEVDLYQLQVNTLRRYKRFYKVSTRPSSNKAQLSEVCVGELGHPYGQHLLIKQSSYLSVLVQTIMKHFKTIPIKEKEILTYFIYMVKSNSNKLDQKNNASAEAT